MSAPPDRGPETYGEIRRKLVERGYLDGRIERFVLRDLLRPGGGAGLLRASLKAAALGAPILGGVLAGAAGLANRPLRSAWDGAVLWGYFALVAGAVLFLLDLAAGWASAALARRRGVRPGDTVRASLLVAIPVLAYLALVWRTGVPGAGMAEEAAFLAASLAATLLVAWLAGLVSLAGIIGRTGQVPDRLRRAVLILVLVLLPVTGSILLARSLASGGSGQVDAEPFRSLPQEGRTVMVGIDGLDADLVEVLEPRGSVENLLGILSRGAVFPLARKAGSEPPEVWTTVMTGVSAEIHGVREAGVERLPGVATPLRAGAGPTPLAVAWRFLLPARTVPSSGAGRSVLALWEISALARKTASVGWWSSWPVPEEGPGNGYTVSDRVLARLLAGRDQGDRDTRPASLFLRLRNEFDGERERIREEFGRRFAGVRGEPLRALLWESFLIDAWNWRTVHRLGTDPEVAASFVYLPGLEILRHRALASSRPEEMADVLDLQRAMEGYVAWLDDLLSSPPASDAARLVLVADPGRSARAASEGFVAAAGDGAAPGCVGPAVGLLDVAPLFLALSGLPASEEMPGRLPSRCLDPEMVRRTRIRSFGRLPLSSASWESEDDPEVIERLRSLGYVR